MHRPKIMRIISITLAFCAVLALQASLAQAEAKGATSGSAHTSQRHWREPIPVVRISSSEEMSLLETGREGWHQKHYACAPGFKCPLDNAPCCKGGKTCCPYGCNDDAEPITCKPNKYKSALHAAQQKIREEARKAEARGLKKGELERKQKKRFSELDRKSRHEHKLKKLATIQEATIKKRRKRKESSTKHATAATVAKQARQEEAEKREEASKAQQRDVPLKNRFENYHRNYRSALYTLVDDLCIVSGMIIGPNQRGRIAKLPQKCRPAERLVFDLHISRASTARYDVLANGDIRWCGGAARDGGKSGHWVPLDGVVFPVAGKVEELRIPLNPPWVDYGRSGYQGGRYHVTKGGMCALSGLVRTSDWKASTMKNPIFTLGPECRPHGGRMVFSVNQHDHSFRIDILPNGEGRFIAGTKDRPWLSLTGLVWFPKSFKPLQLLNGWRRLNRKFRMPSLRKYQNLCVLSGVAGATAGWRSVMARLPPQCRPAKRLVFHINAHEKSARVDVLPNGFVQWIAGQKKDWVTFDGIRFVVP